MKGLSEWSESLSCFRSHSIRVKSVKIVWSLKTFAIFVQT